MLERGASLAVVASIMGWSASTTATMAKRYGHIGDEAQRAALEALVAPPPPGGRKTAPGGRHRADSWPDS